jgi:hypothetical protein
MFVEKQGVDSERVMREFKKRQTRQLLLISLTLLSLLILTLVYARPDLFGEVSKKTISSAQIGLIFAFIGVNAYNWRCPACNKYLGRHIVKHRCGQCGARLQ